MIRKMKVTVSPLQKLEYAKLMVEQGYTNKQIDDMMSAIQSNLVSKGTYQRLVFAEKPNKVAIVAYIRKMVISLNSMLRDGVLWEAPKS